VQDSNLVTSADNAVDSLERLATQLESGELRESLTWKGILTWGWHAVALLAYMRMQPNRESFDAWLWDYLDEGSPALEVARDARWEERQRLSLLEIIDIFSEVELPILKPEFYQGWTDRSVRCHTIRRRVVDIVGRGIDEEHRQGLLVLLATYHRLMRFPSPVNLDVSQLQVNLGYMLALLESLIDLAGPRGVELLDRLGRCKIAIDN